MEVLCWEVYCYLFLYEKLSSVEWFKTIHIYYLTVSVGQIFGHNFPGSSASGFPTSCNRSISQGWGFIWRLSRVKICFIGRIQFQKGCQTEDPSSFHAVRLTVLLPHWLLASSVQFSRSVMSNSLRPHEPQHARPPCPSPTPGVYPNPCPLSQWLPYNHLILCRPLFFLPSIFPSIRVFSNESVLRIRWPKYWSFSLSISPSNEHPRLISFRMDWLDLLAVQGTLKSLLQHHSSKASILWHSAFFIVQLSHPYMTTGKTIALTRQTFVDKVMSLLFNMLSRLVITFLPRSKPLLISWLQSPSAVILEPKK